MPTPAMEDYLEKIYGLIEEKGYARVMDIASSLNVNPPAVTKMIQKLDERGFCKYEKYRGIILTLKGKKIAKSMAEKHQILEDFLRVIGVHEENIYEEAEGIEHHISKHTAFCISGLVRFFEDNPFVKESYLTYLNKMTENDPE
ncbi:transcriptional regulator MntR [Effusibacillus lacus]|uniref:Manganese transport regulator n=1 Tax=Effusibacillus lacus TaxID=1348429 RepID=A0A292YRW6_9BACL|nr:transcriptional regulator MntR [Effusibacillus lacus]GAX91661.1 manganese transport transcriptional regulator [Effusibacillus lacus]